MKRKEFVIERGQIIIHTEGEICTTNRELVNSGIFNFVVGSYLEKLKTEESPIFQKIGLNTIQEIQYKDWVISLMQDLSESLLDVIAEKYPFIQKPIPDSQRIGLHEFTEGLYDFWRSFDRYMVLHAMPGPSSFDQRPYRSFNATIEALSHTVRAVYRDICENITGAHPRVYRQVSAGCNIGLIALPAQTRIATRYQSIIANIPFIRQVWITPPMIMDPPMNVRTGEFERVSVNPLEGAGLNKSEWLCYPACVGTLTIFIYFHQSFIGLGCTLANLFELAQDDKIEAGPDAVYFFGVPDEMLKRFGTSRTVFFDDVQNNLVVAAVPCKDEFGYFGYLKKMTLTLHNIIMMRKGRMPFHGAMVYIKMKTGNKASLLIIGDTATGKSETLEAFRILGKGIISEMRIIADDMGTIAVNESGVLGFGTEIGAFIRLDDLQQGYAFDQIDRAIIMSPQKTNARVVLPVTTYTDIVAGYPIDFLLYANNYEKADADHPLLSNFGNPEEALRVFKEGAAMAKGTTTAIGLVHSYFANIFGPAQYQEMHDPLALRTFQAAFKNGVWVGELRTQLGIKGYETEGPQRAAEALLKLIESR